MRSLVTVFGMVVLGLASLMQTTAAAAPAESANAPIRFEQVIAIVFDANGNPTPGLRAKEFVVEQDGKKSTVVGFNPGSDVPMSLIIMIDKSKQMAPMLPNAMVAVKPLLSMLGPRDEYAIYSFDTDLHPVLPFSPIRAADVPKVTAAVQALTAAGQTTQLYNVVADGAAKMKEAKYTRRALVVVTDAKDRDAGNIGAIIRASSLNNVAIYAIGLTGTVRKPGDDAPKKETLADLAAANKSLNLINKSTSLTDAGLQDVAGGLRASTGGGMGGMGGGGFGRSGGMGGGGSAFGGYSSPFGGGGGGNFNPSAYGCNSQNSGFSSNSNFGTNFAVFQNQANQGGSSKFNDRFNQTAFNQNSKDLKDICANSNNGGFGSFFGMGSASQNGVISVSKSAMLDLMVKNGGGRGIIIDFTGLSSTDLGAAQATQSIFNLGQDINQDLRGQYTLGYYTTSEEAVDKRITVKLSFEHLRAQENERIETELKESAAELADMIKAARLQVPGEAAAIETDLKERAAKQDDKIKATRMQLPDEASFKVVLQTKIVTVATPEKAPEKTPEKTPAKAPEKTPAKSATQKGK